ncbi:hypothetical protein ACQJBY_003639 [Aegilops geniculata]
MEIPRLPVAARPVGSRNVRGISDFRPVRCLSVLSPHAIATATPAPPFALTRGVLRRRCGAAAMEALSSSRFSSALPSLLDHVPRPPNPPQRHRHGRRRCLQTLPSPPADAAAPSPSSSPPLSRILAAALRGGRARGELPDLAAAGGGGGAGIGTLLMSTTAAAVTKARESPYLLALAANPTFVSGMVAFAVA